MMTRDPIERRLPRFHVTPPRRDYYSATMSIDAEASPAPASRQPQSPAPRSPAHLFLAFNRLALRGFGGVLPWAQRTLVEEEGWLSNREFVEMLALAQVLPGPNIGNLALMIGDRFFGLRGALMAISGMFAAPLVIVIALAMLYSGFSDQPTVAAALRGMGAVSAGLIVGTAVKLVRASPPDRAGWVMMAATFLMVGLLRWPLVWVMLGVGTLSVWLAWKRGRP